MSAFGGKADVNYRPAERPLIARNRHWRSAHYEALADYPVENKSETGLGMTTQLWLLTHN